MECLNDLCVYEKNGNCCIDEISINEIGMCTELIYITVSDEEKKKLKRDAIERFNRNDY